MVQLRKHSPDRNGTLFPLATPFRFVELGKIDAQRSTDNLRVLRDLIVANQEMYPNIDRWFSRKVIPGLRSSERVAYVAFEDERPIASAVLKLGENSKFCHLRIHQEFQDMYLGQMFFTQMILDVRRRAKEIHFTLPESLWNTREKFFESFGFSRATKASRQYRNGDTELLCSAPLVSVWNQALRKLPTLMAKFSPGNFLVGNRILISLKPKYADQILGGSKFIEIRKRFSRQWASCRAVLYSSSPVSALVGEATINSVTYCRPDEAWSQFEPSLGCSYEEFRSYVGSASQVSAIQLGHVVPYQTPISLTQLSSVMKEGLRPPQSFCDLKVSKDCAWGRAASLVSLVNATVGSHQTFVTGVQSSLF